MTELDFLIELLLDHDLQANTKKRLAERIREVGSQVGNDQRPRPAVMAPRPAPATYQGAPQAASTMAALLRHDGMQAVAPEVAPPPAPVEVIAQTPAAIQAMASRQQAIMASMTGTVNKETGRPRKF